MLYWQNNNLIEGWRPSREMLPDEALEEFKKIWSEEFGEEISDDVALEEGLNLLNLFNVIYKPIKKEWLKDEEEKSRSP